MGVNETSLLWAADCRDLQAARSEQGHANVLEAMKEAERASGLENKER